MGASKPGSGAKSGGRPTPGAQNGSVEAAPSQLTSTPPITRVEVPSSFLGVKAPCRELMPVSMIPRTVFAPPPVAVRTAGVTPDNSEL